MPAPPLLFPHHWFRDLPESVAQQFIALSVPRDLKKGEFLYHVGEEPESFCLVEAGRLRLGRTTEDQDFVIAYADPGDWVGEVPLLDGLPHVSDALAVMDTRLLLVSRRKFDTMLRQQPELYRHFAQRLCSAMRLAVGLYADMALLPLPARLAKRLLELAATFGVQTEAMVRIDLKLSQEELAGMMTSSRQSVSKELKLWQSRGWIDMKYSTVFIKRADALEALVRRSGRY